MLQTLPKSNAEVQDWQWADFEPYFQELQETELTEANVQEWLANWTELAKLVNGGFALLRLGVNRNTADTVTEENLNQRNAKVLPPYRKAEHALTQKLLDSKLQPIGMEVPLRKMQTAAEIFREENLPLAVQEQKLTNEHGKITGTQTLQWEGQEVTVIQLKPFQQSPDRSIREKAWRAGMERQLQDRPALNELWGKLLRLRQEMAKNAGEANYRDLRWKMLNRFDYTPADCENFHAAIEEVVVPAAKRVLESRRERLGLDTMRPWDLEAPLPGAQSLKPFENVAELKEKAETIFDKVDPQLAEFYATMQQEDLLDLENRMNKRPGGFCTAIPASNSWRPFIFMNAVGLPADVTTLLHESGHAFHAFETLKLPYTQQWIIGSEFAEVASMAMELLASPYITKGEGGYYTEQEAAQARLEHLENIILFWPYMAVVDAFQHWAYTADPKEAADAANCDRVWDKLWSRFKADEDWSGLDDARMTGWHRKLHIYQYPFYYVEYGMAQLGAVQIWANALQDQKMATASYRGALKLGGTATLPELYQAAGAKLAFDGDTLRHAIDLLENQIEKNRRLLIRP